MKPTDPRTTWWFWRPVQERLITFTLALVSPLRGRRYRVQLKAEGTGFCDPYGHLIQANPALFPAQPALVQFRATQGILAHEAAHALFTESWPQARDDTLCQLTNLLEDERIEQALCRFYPGLTPAIRLLGDLLWEEMHGSHADPRWQAVLCCLGWRWAHTRADEDTLLAKLEVSEQGAELWRSVRPLVEEAWRAPNTTRVIERAQAILDTLGLPHRTPPLPELSRFSSRRGIPARRSGKTLDAPAPCPTHQPGLGDVGEPEGVVEDEHLQPAPYLALEEAALPLARQLAEALRQPEPDLQPQPHEWRGRFSFRQETRTPDTPCLHAQGLARRPRSLALYVLVDRSGSMDVVEPQVRLALMTLALAASELAIPFGLSAFGASDDRDEQALTFPLREPIATGLPESTKALIAGYGGTTDFEFLNWGLRVAERALRARPERLRAVIVIHDGQPCYRGGRGDDWTQSKERLQAMEAHGLTPIGVYLGQRAEDVRRLKELFHWLVVCSGEQLPERLGDLLRSLA
jgi:hypothetical protein